MKQGILPGFEEVGEKFDDGKLRYSLIPPSTTHALAEVLTFGANKYSTYGIIPVEHTLGGVSKRWNKNVLSVVKIAPNLLKGYAETVIVNNEKQKPQYAHTVIGNHECTLNELWNAETATRLGTETKIQGLNNANGPQQKNGLRKTQNDAKSIAENVMQTLTKENVIKLKNGQLYYHGMGLLNTSMIVYVKKDACFANAQMAPGTWTTIIQQVNSEGYFVVDATTDLECWEIIYKVLKGLSLISNEPQQLIKSAANSWKNVPNAKLRYLDAAMRHLEAYRSGEVLDKESELSHLKHLLTNIAFLIELER